MSPNQHISKYLDYYADSASRERHAVLIHGKWGSGKTHFIKKWRQKHDSSNKSACLYVSLYGLESIAQIQDAFFAQLHPVLASKSMQFVGALGRGFLQGALKLNLDGDKGSEASMSGDASKAADKALSWLNNVEERILIFDDLERCAIHVDVILGYINSLVEHRGCKAILLANEDEIHAFHSVTGNRNTSQIRYRTIKEKLIGKTFHIEPDIDAAVEVFLKEVGEPTREILKSCLNEILELHSVMETQNLRNLHVLFQDLQRVFQLFSEQSRMRLFDVNGGETGEEFLHKFVRDYAFYTFHIRAGHIRGEDIALVLDSARKFVISRNEQELTAKSEKLQEKYSRGLGITARNMFQMGQNRIELFGPQIPSPELWTKLFTKHSASSQEMDEAVDAFFEWRSPTREPWKKLISIWSLSDSEFKEIWSEIKLDLNNRKERRLGVLLHIFGLQLYLAEQGVGEYSMEFVTGYVRKYFSDLTKYNYWDIEGDNFYEAYDLAESYDSHGYWGMDVKGFKELVSFGLELQRKQERVKLNEQAKAKIIIHLHDSNWLRENLSRGRGRGVFSEAPVLAEVDQFGFIDTLINLSPVIVQLNTIRAIKSRYQDCLPDKLETFRTERPLFEKLREEVDKRVVTNGPTSRLGKKRLIERIDEILELLS